jgi:hypothetical protein
VNEGLPPAFPIFENLLRVHTKSVFFLLPPKMPAGDNRYLFFHFAAVYSKIFYDCCESVSVSFHFSFSFIPFFCHPFSPSLLIFSFSLGIQVKELPPLSTYISKVIYGRVLFVKAKLSSPAFHDGLFFFFVFVFFSPCFLMVKFLFSPES